MNKDNDLLKYLEQLRAKTESKDKEMKNYANYYNGEVAKADSNLNHAYNIIKPIVETKVTIVSKAQVTPCVLAQYSSLQSTTDIDMVDKVSAVGDDLRKHLWDINKERSFDESSLRQASIKGVTVARVSWDKQMCGGLGDITADILDPALCRWEYSVSNPAEMNYFFYEPLVTLMDIKKKYGYDEKGEPKQEVLDILNKIQSESKTGSGKSSNSPKNGKTTNYTVNGVGGQVFAYNNGAGTSSTEKVKVIEVIFKDDTIFMPNEKDGTPEKDKEDWRYKYEAGRKITYISQGENRIILEDEPVDDKIGIGIRLFSWMPSVDADTVSVGTSEVKDLMYIQERMIKLAARRAKLIQQHQRYLVYDPRDLKIGLNDFTDESILAAEGLANSPNAIQEKAINYIQDVQFLTDIMQEYKQEALTVARLNDTMLSGQHEAGVRSAKQVESLKEQPLNTIESIQGRYVEFKNDITLLMLKMVQEYYNVPRIVRIGGGTKFVKFPTQEPLVEDEATGAMGVSESQPPISIQGKDSEVAETIKTDLRLFDFDIDIVSGFSQARSPQENSELTMVLLNAGVFSGQYGMETVKMVLRNTDFPNRSAIITEMEEKAKAQAEDESSKPEWMKMLQAEPDTAKVLTELLKSVKAEYNSALKAEIFTGLGFESVMVDKLVDAPAQTITAKGEPDKVAAIAPEMVSHETNIAEAGAEVAIDIIELQSNKNGQQDEPKKDIK